MTLKAKCPCGHVFTFDTDKVAVKHDLLEDEGGGDRRPPHYLPKCPKCAKQLEVPHPKKP